MAKRFKFPFSGVIQFCRPSKHPSDLPSDPFLLSSSLKWTKSHNWYVFNPDLPRRKIYNTAEEEDDEPEEEDKPTELTRVPLPPPKGNRRTRTRRLKKKKKKKSYSDENRVFSEDEQDPKFISNSNSNSSRSFSTDSEFSPHLQTIRETPTIRPKKQSNKKKRMKKVKNQWPEPEEEAARLSVVFRKLVPCTAVEVEGKMRESLAVVKRSERPYEDFKKSMVEMIVEKEMVEEKDLQELLRCFLSLNSEQHQRVIVRAFQDICRALFFSQSSSSSS